MNEENKVSITNENNTLNDNTTSTIKSESPTETQRDWFNLTNAEFSQYIENSNTKKFIYELFKQYASGKFTLTEEETNSLNDLLFSIYLHSFNDNRFKFFYEDSNSLKIYNDCLEILSDKQKIIKVLTYLFLKNQILITREITQETSEEKIKETFYSDFFQNDNLVEHFLTAMDNLENKQYHCVIYPSANCISFSKIIAEKTNNMLEQQRTIHGMQQRLEDTQSNFITIVALIVSIVPLLTVNLQIIVNNFNLANILAVNGILLFVIGIIFYMISSVLPTKNKSQINSCIFIVTGILLVVISLVLPCIIILYP